MLPLMICAAHGSLKSFASNSWRESNL